MMLYSLRTARTAMKPSMAFRFDVSRTRSSLRLMTVRVPLPTRACTCTSYSYSSITRTPMSNKLTLVRSLSSRIPHDSDEPRPPPPPLPQPQPEPKRGLIGGTIFAGSMLFGKTKYVLAALKVTKMAPLASMLITSATYSLFFGWPYAIGMVGLIFVHECGHAVAMRHYDVPFSPMVFVPFMGAVIAMKDHPRNAYQEGVIGLAGPVAGSAAALTLGVSGAMLDSQLMIALADWGYIINLFNLMPVGSMDGGRVLSAVSPYFGVAGVLGGAGCIYYDLIGNPIFYLIMLGGTYSSVQRVMGWDQKYLPPNYYNLDASSQAKLFAAYLALVGFLLAAMTSNNQRRKSPAQLKNEQHHGEYLISNNEGDLWDQFHQAGLLLEDDDERDF